VTLRLLAATGVVAALLAASVGITSGAGAEPAKAKAKVPRGVTATSIRVGGLGDSLFYGGADIGARARFQRANADGGVNGRTIDYVGFTDDGGDPASDTAAAASLARPGGVFAVVPAVAPDLAGASVLVKRQVPYFGWALSSNFCGTALGFGFTGCQVSSGSTSNVWGLLVRQAFGPGPQSTGKTAAILTESTPSGEYELRALKAGLAAARLTVVSAASSLPVPAIADYSTIAGGVLTSAGGHQPDSVFVVGSASSVLGVQQALRAASYVGVFTNVLEYDPNLVAPASGAFVAIQTAATETAPQNPAMQQLITDVRKVAPDQPIDQAVVAGYFSADLFLDAVKQAGKHLTVARLVQVANRITYRVANTVGPTTFPAAHDQPTPCGSLVASNGVAFTVPVPYSCGRVVAVK
jgi:branched-chain amino acid transport system substrate-binding protein